MIKWVVFLGQKSICAPIAKWSEKVHIGQKLSKTVGLAILTHFGALTSLPRLVQNGLFLAPPGDVFDSWYVFSL